MRGLGNTTKTREVRTAAATWVTVGVQPGVDGGGYDKGYAGDRGYGSGGWMKE